jgi:hypothetical protein
MNQDVFINRNFLNTGLGIGGFPGIGYGYAAPGFASGALGGTSSLLPFQMFGFPTADLSLGGLGLGALGGGFGLGLPLGLGFGGLGLGGLGLGWGGGLGGLGGLGLLGVPGIGLGGFGGFGGIGAGAGLGAGQLGLGGIRLRKGGRRRNSEEDSYESAESREKY